MNDRPCFPPAIKISFEVMHASLNLSCSEHVVLLAAPPISVKQINEVPG